ncbi:Z1 domain-containing protein [Kitasatospora sp. NPDC052896]|uniref:Z1 domain-containing protein n=1 Tax=Kitasatospora sp. NPDC052896 TaxID=3364061 RepID=UPI0037C95FEC
MSSAGDRLEKHLYVLQAMMDRDGLSLEEILTRHPTVVPVEEHAELMQYWKEQQRQATLIRVLRPTELSPAGPRDWSRVHDTSTGYFWNRQRAYLQHRLHRKTYEIDSTDRASDRVLAHLEDPRHPEPFNVRGLVVGHVQSGKTANFSALIAKAADAGYKIVIVLSGLHNSLRRQTQRRLQRDLGHENWGPPRGVGQGDQWWTWITGEGLDEDFDPNGNAGVLQGQNQVIMVVKKNKSRLDRLLTWVEKVPAHVPVLVIDDEADQASVNTGGNRAEAEPIADMVDLTAIDFEGGVPSEDEFDPSAINLRIRKLIDSFARCAYVAYTATPFANILINPNASDWEAGADLFPQDFILTLPHPPGAAYVGPERLFGREPLPGEATGLDGLDVIQIVPDLDVEQVAPPRARKAFTPRVPDSLRQALIDFFLAASARVARSGIEQPCTMLIHADMRKDVQDGLSEALREELGTMRQRWRYDRGDFLPELRQRWNTDFRPLIASVDLERDVPFDALVPFLDEFITPDLVRVLNSNHDDELDFDLEPDLKAILIGGNKLSRGVTVDGLLISYFVRRTPYYDTLLQMGRWFGYRGDYVDLTRLYSTELLIRWFHDLATIEEDLRRQIEHYAFRKLSPSKVAPEIRSHAKMLPTSRNKMKDAELVQASSFDGRKLQTIRYSFDSINAQDIFNENLAAGRELLGQLGAPTHVVPGRLGWQGVSPELVICFLQNFRFFEQVDFDPDAVVDYIQARLRHGELVSWRIMVSYRQGTGQDEETIDLAITDHSQISMVRRSRLAKDPTSLGVVTVPEDELFGLTEQQRESALQRHANGEFTSLGDAYRSERSGREGLLVLYPISPASPPGEYAKNRRALFDEGAKHPECVLAYSLVFPYSNSDAGTTYVAGPTSDQQ